jgi:hypothetical protein
MAQLIMKKRDTKRVALACSAKEGTARHLRSAGGKWIIFSLILSCIQATTNAISSGLTHKTEVPLPCNQVTLQQQPSSHQVHTSNIHLGTFVLQPSSHGEGLTYRGAAEQGYFYYSMRFRMWVIGPAAGGKRVALACSAKEGTATHLPLAGGKWIKFFEGKWRPQPGLILSCVQATTNAILSGLTQVKTEVPPPCNHVTLQQPSAQQVQTPNTHLGTFVRQATLHNERPTYKQNGGGAALYFATSGSMWLVGSKVGSKTNLWLAAKSTVHSADRIDAKWIIYEEHSWKPYFHLNVSCGKSLGHSHARSTHAATTAVIAAGADDDEVLAAGGGAVAGRAAKGYRVPGSKQSQVGCATHCIHPPTGCFYHEQLHNTTTGCAINCGQMICTCGDHICQYPETSSNCPVDCAFKETAVETAVAGDRGRGGGGREAVGGVESTTKEERRRRRSASGCDDLKDSSKVMTCMITGDPHTLMFAGSGHDYQGVGEYILAESKDGGFAVHTCMRRVEDFASPDQVDEAAAKPLLAVVTSVIVNSPYARVSVDSTGKIKADGKPVSVGMYKGCGISPSLLTFPTGERVHIKHHSTADWAGFSNAGSSESGASGYLTVLVELPLSLYCGNVQGLCGVRLFYLLCFSCENTNNVCFTTHHCRGLSRIAPTPFYTVRTKDSGPTRSTGPDQLPQINTRCLQLCSTYAFVRYSCSL